MSMERRQVLTGIGGLTTVAVAGCLGGDERGTTLWHDFTDAEESDLETYLETFNEGREDTLDAEGISEIEDQLDTALAAGDGPETFAWAHDWIGVYDDQGFVYDASDDVSVDLGSEYTEAAAQAVQWDGAVYGLPYAAETVSLMYNAEMVDQPPETIDEMVSIMEEHHDPENGQYGLSCPAIDPYFLSGYLQAFGGYIFDEQNEELGIEADEFIEGVELVQNSIWEYVPNDPSYESQVPVFNDGNAPFAINGPWELAGFRDAGIDAQVAPLPGVEGGEPSPYTGIQTWYFTSQLEDAEEAALGTTIDWAEWYTTNEDVIIGNAQNHGAIPVHQDYVEHEDLGDDVQQFAETVGMGVPMPSHPMMDQVWTPFEEALERVFQGQAGPTESMESAAEEIRGRWE
ncbi:carbohydrate ABC transporter substrate-binding protein (CUT1 family) [Halopiger aswanensis]|uniref:Carbohydrate ABC transporter substrate-binding protein (CUT1 family) n=2 Tax=Halopiger aswanensis TaxID=148449 RepID=A0A3R7KKY8_9EURY|nr:carbohydrate ABC transporter substrate-binding protein (CUT1 family) [Halopiger aswanensis]